MIGRRPIAEPASGAGTQQRAAPVVVTACFEGDFEQGLAASERARAALGNISANYIHMAWSLAWLGRTQQAIEWIQRLEVAAPTGVHTQMARLLRQGLARDVAGARAGLSNELREWCRREMFWSYLAAASFALAGSEEDALDWLENAERLGFSAYPLLARYSDAITLDLRRIALAVRYRTGRELGAGSAGQTH